MIDLQDRPKILVDETWSTGTMALTVRQALGERYLHSMAAWPIESADGAVIIVSGELLAPFRRGKGEPEIPSFEMKPQWSELLARAESDETFRVVVISTNDDYPAETFANAVGLPTEFVATGSTLAERIAEMRARLDGVLYENDHELSTRFRDAVGARTRQSSSTTDGVDWVSDARAKADLLQRRPLARALATRLNRFRVEDPESSFLIHIDGRWGTGKSTLLDLLKDELADQWRVVEFDAWRQMRVGPPWWALLASLRHAIRCDLGWVGSTRLRFAEAAQRGRQSGPLYAVALTSLVVVVGLLGLGVDLGGINKTLSSILVVLGSVGTLMAAASAVGRFLLWDSAAGAKIFEQSHRDPMESVADHFAWLITRAAKPVVFFIDDLDRCSNDYVVDLLDSVQTLVRDSPSRRSSTSRSAACHVVVAADGRWIRTSYEQAHAVFADAVAEPGRPLGHLFLTKMFQLTLDIPSISEHRRDAYVRALLRGNDDSGGTDLASQLAVVERRVDASTTEAEALAAYDQAAPHVRAAVADKVVEKLAEPQVQHTTEHSLERFAPLLEPNPRAMKLFVNAYGMARTVQILEDNVVPRGPLALWTIVRTRWPGLADYLRAHPDAISVIAGGTPASAAIPDGIAALFAASDVREVLEYADGGPLTASLIRACCGMGENGAA